MIRLGRRRICWAYFILFCQFSLFEMFGVLVCVLVVVSWVGAWFAVRRLPPTSNLLRKKSNSDSGLLCLSLLLEERSEVRGERSSVIWGWRAWPGASGTSGTPHPRPRRSGPSGTRSSRCGTASSKRPRAGSPSTDSRTSQGQTSPQPRPHALMISPIIPFLLVPGSRVRLRLRRSTSRVRSSPSVGSAASAEFRTGSGGSSSRTSNSSPCVTHHPLTPTLPYSPLFPLVLHRAGKSKTTRVLGFLGFFGVLGVFEFFVEN